jgi:hypothetical protein
MPKMKIALAWKNNLQRLAEFSRTHGHCNVPFKGELRMLAKWATRQRTKAQLSVEQISMLESIGYSWETKQEKDDAAWNATLERLATYKRKHGHCSVPQTYHANPELGTWVANQRRLDKQKKVTPERKAKLDELGFVWSVWSPKEKPKKGTNSNAERKWEQMFGKLKEYKAKHGDCRVPYNFVQDTSLAMWVSTQRREYSQKSWYGENRQIREDRKERLDSIDFSWENKVEKVVDKAAKSLLALALLGAPRMMTHSLTTSGEKNSAQAETTVHKSVDTQMNDSSSPSSSSSQRNQSQTVSVVQVTAGNFVVV